MIVLRGAASIAIFRSFWLEALARGKVQFLADPFIIAIVAFRLVVLHTATASRWYCMQLQSASKHPQVYARLESIAGFCIIVDCHAPVSSAAAMLFCIKPIVGTPLRSVESEVRGGRLWRRFRVALEGSLTLFEELENGTTGSWNARRWRGGGMWRDDKVVCWTPSSAFCIWDAPFEIPASVASKRVKVAADSDFPVLSGQRERKPE